MAVRSGHLAELTASGTNTKVNKGTNKEKTYTTSGLVSTTPTVTPPVDVQPGAAVGYSAPSASNVTVGQSPSGYKNADSFDDNEDDNSANDYWAKYLKQMQAADAAQKAAVQAAVDQSVNSLNAQKTTTAQDYADQYRQLYLNNMQSQKNIGQQMAAQGITGGASESTLLGLNTNYEDNLRQGKVAEQNALSTLDQAITNAQLSGSIEAANNSATNATNTANAYLTAWQQQLAADQTAAQLAASQNSENRQYAYNWASTMLSNGQMPSDELLNTAGISKADAQTIVAQQTAAKASAYSSSSAGKGKDSSTTENDADVPEVATPTVGDIEANDVLTMLQNGESKQVVSDAIALARKYYQQNANMTADSKARAKAFLDQLQSRNNAR